MRRISLPVVAGVSIFPRLDRAVAVRAVAVSVVTGVNTTLTATLTDGAGDVAGVARTPTLSLDGILSLQVNDLSGGVNFLTAPGNVGAGAGFLPPHFEITPQDRLTMTISGAITSASSLVVSYEELDEE